MWWNVSLVGRSLEEQQKCISELNIDSGSVLLADDIRTHMCEKNRIYVILTQVFSPLSQEFWRQLPARRVFVLHEALLETASDPLPFSRGALFMPTSVTTLHAATAFDILQRALNLVQKYPELANNIASVHDISNFC
ncbi:uncharacterized protein Aud_009236 [Aspergillus udagawae]|uniref:Uncharacterized protein n=1 Tax=Aspergillus udagawae TaxID=91492 RepID=A0A8E0QYF4_9EURO|nr:uncharacterized protein Aud_009236 [Aspergillus udagawae]GIC92765.1 hypothetical protein Aud_009236 [Aspergillus udagawae]